MSSYLTDEELLLLDNLMYLTDSATGKFETVEDLVNYYLKHPELLGKSNLSGGFESKPERMTEILEAISDHPKLMDLQIGKSHNDEVRGTEFYVEGVDGSRTETIVAFRGTGGIYEAWHDNFEGAYLADTDAQIKAAEFVRSLGVEGITVTGHSKGGNFAMYCTVVLGDIIKDCVSFDGQGFGELFLDKYGDEISYASPKIRSISAYNDFVNILLTSIAGEVLYFDNYGTGGDAHSPFTFWDTNKEMYEETGGMFLDLDEWTVAQDSTMAALHDLTLGFLEHCPPELSEYLLDSLSPTISMILSSDKGNTWFRGVSDIWLDRLEFVSQSDNILEAAFRFVKTAGFTIFCIKLYTIAFVGKKLIGALMALFERVKKAWQSFIQKMKNIVSTIKKKAKDIWDSICSWTSNLIDGCKNALDTAWEWTKDTVEDVWNSTTEFVEETANTIAEGIESAWGWIKKKAASVWDSTKSAIVTIGTKLEIFVDDVVDKGGKMVYRLKESIRNMVNSEGPGIISRMRDYSAGCWDFFLGRIHEFRSDAFEDIKGLYSRFSGESWMRRLSIDGCVGKISDLYEQAEDGIDIIKDGIEEGFDKVRRIDNILMDSFRNNVGALKDIQEIIFE